MHASPLRFRFSWLAATLAGLALQATMAACARAAPVYRCTGTHGETMFQAEPCASPKDKGVVEVREQPLIDPSAPPAAARSAVARGGKQRKVAATHHANRRVEKTPASYECRASDGEVFYRHSRCPGTVKGDGVARFGAQAPQASSRRGRTADGGAWGTVKVAARKIPREEACRRINALTTSDRDGHERDEQVSVYDHNTGRDPCEGI
ncbi:MAG TPA: DUF4124 domain-containing protein [Rhodanobacteraceae bacterium]|nr:DUF4124 domain-containing protein [Rhodanobacteraceae bacterium]